MLIRKLHDRLKKYDDNVTAVLAGSAGSAVMAGSAVLVGSAVSAVLAGLAVLAVLAGLAVSAVLAGLAGLIFLGYALASVPLLWLALGFVAALEAAYWLDRKSIRSDALPHVALKKLEAGADVLLLGGIVGWFKYAADNLGALAQYWPVVVQLFGYLGLALLGCAAVWAYLKLNAMAYKRHAGRTKGRLM